MSLTTDPTQERGFVRLLGPMEQFLWAANLDQPTHFAMAAHIEGHISPERWRLALDAAQRRHPLCSVCIEVDADGAPYFRFLAGASIPLRSVQSDAGMGWAAEMERELSEAFPVQGAILVRAVLISEANRVTFLLVAHHAIADGFAMIFVMRDILLALTGVTRDALPVAPSQEERLGLQAPAKGKGDFTSGSIAVSTLPSAGPPKEVSPPQVDHVRLTPELTAQVRTRAREEGTTMHGALSAALALAGRRLSQEWQQRPVRVLSPIDTRKMLDQEEDCVVRVSVGMVRIEPEANPDFWEIARFAKQSLAESQAREGIEGGLNALQQALLTGPDVTVAAHLMENVFIHDVLLTNLGHLPYDTAFGDLKLTALWGPAVMGQGDRQTIGVVTTEGALHLTHTSYTPIPSLLQATEQVLVAACGS